jgi:hypothetical protein
MNSNRGVFLHNILFAAVFSPTVMLGSEQWLGWLACQIIGIIIVRIYLFNFPELQQHKKYYLVSQTFGVFLGLLMYLLPSQRDWIAGAWIVLSFIFFFKPLMGVYMILSAPVERNNQRALRRKQS